MTNHYGLYRDYRIAQIMETLARLQNVLATYPQLDPVMLIEEGRAQAGGFAN